MLKLRKVISICLACTIFMAFDSTYLIAKAETISHEEN